MLKRRALTSLASCLLLVLPIIMTGCQSLASPTPPSDDTGTLLGETYVSVTGTVLPSRWASLSFGISGLVKDT